MIIPAKPLIDATGAARLIAVLTGPGAGAAVRRWFR